MKLEPPPWSSERSAASTPACDASTSWCACYRTKSPSRLAVVELQVVIHGGGFRYRWIQTRDDDSDDAVEQLNLHGNFVERMDGLEAFSGY